MRLQPVVRDLRPQYNQLQNFFCNTSQGRPRRGHSRPSSNTSFLNCNFLSGSLNTTCVGPESKFPIQKLAETQALGIKQNRGSWTAPLLSICFPGDCPISLRANPRLARKFTADCDLQHDWVCHSVAESAKVSDLSVTPQVHLETWRWPIELRTQLRFCTSSRTTQNSCFKKWSSFQDPGPETAKQHHYDYKRAIS